MIYISVFESFYIRFKVPLIVNQLVAYLFLITVYVETRSQRTHSSSPDTTTHESKKVLQ